MIPKECKRLAEVDFPIAEVSKHAAREKEAASLLYCDRERGYYRRTLPARLPG